MYEYQNELATDALAPSAARTLRPNWVPRGNEVCLNILLVSAELDGVMGIARQAEQATNQLGGFCEDRIQSSKLYNVAVVNAPVFNTSSTSASSPYVVSTWSVLVAVMVVIKTLLYCLA